MSQEMELFFRLMFQICIHLWPTLYITIIILNLISPALFILFVDIFFPFQVTLEYNGLHISIVTKSVLVLLAQSLFQKIRLEVKIDYIIIRLCILLTVPKSDILHFIFLYVCRALLKLKYCIRALLWFQKSVLLIMFVSWNVGC